MAQTIPSGAYVIRNRDTFGVIHADSYQNTARVITSGRLEEHYLEQQIWWMKLT